MIGRFEGTVATSASVSSLGSPSTRMSFNAGRYRSTGSSSWSFPCSTKVIAATQVIGFVIDWMAKIASSVMGVFAARSRYP